MSILLERPLERALTKRQQIERELKKCPDFHRYLLTTSPGDRTRMERVLMEIPSFRLWRALTHSIKDAELSSKSSGDCGVKSRAPDRPRDARGEWSVWPAD